MSETMKRIAIFGVGLIGGSLALCFKGQPGLHVVGFSNNPKSIDKYLKHGVVDEATSSIEEAASNADFIFLCVPVGMLEYYLQQLHNMKLKQGCIITDVGSTKNSIVQFSEKLMQSGTYFIGGHPMAGKEKSGVEAATSRLFENAFYVLTPTPSVPERVFEQLVQLLNNTKAQIVRIDPYLHDEIVGAISHLPHIIAVALVNQISQYNDSNDLYQLLAAGGFRDITRIASSDPVIWRDILLNNKVILLRLLQDWNAEVATFIQLLEDDNGEGIEREFLSAGLFRNQLPERRKGIIQSQYEIYVDVPDEPGIIGKITTQLGDHRVNLSNIQIIENRMDEPGVLRLSFREEEDMSKAVDLLKQMKCIIHI
jgi:prephenate dehydrogenase